jgi:tetraacyldisaccharide 4'-kinase
MYLWLQISSYLLKVPYMKWWQIFLWPLSLLYGIVMAFRNWLYDHGWLKSYSFDVPTIVVGNLEMGGSGKSPFVDLLTSILKKNYKIGILSRGYGRSFYSG